MVWPVQLGALHGAVPVELSRRGTRHGWRSDGTRPGVTNLAGLLPLGAGAALIGWALAVHYKAAPGKSWAIKRSLEPEYLLTNGPYRFSRNPMHVGGIAIWGGWSAWFGSVPVATGLAVLTAFYRVGIVWEEQMLARRWGGEWHEYASRTARWLSSGRCEPNPPRRSEPRYRVRVCVAVRVRLPTPGTTSRRAGRQCRGSTRW